MDQLKKSRPVIIDFNVCSMGVPIFARLEESKLISCTCDYSLSKEIRNSVDVSSKRLDLFWKKVDDLNIWSWKKDFNDIGYVPVCDGLDWELKLRSPNQKTLYSKGIQEFPDNFDEFIKVLNHLFEAELL